MRQIRILWVDDEVGVLRSHILFLNERGFETDTCNSGNDAINMVREKPYDIIFLDEYMPGLSGIETLRRIKAVRPTIPVVMITKSEEEDIMDEALGNKIADYLIKPVNPKQILLSIKKNIDTKRLVTQKITSNYQSQFSQLCMQINSARYFSEWVEIYKKLVYWEGELESGDTEGMEDVLRLQKVEANKEFSRFVRANYQQWFSGELEETPLISTNLFRKK